MTDRTGFVLGGGDRDALVVLRDGVPAAERLTFDELGRMVRILAVWLQTQRAAGERVVIAQSDPVQFAVSLLACLYAGAVAVPAPVPGGPHSHDRRLLGIVRDAAARFAITGADHAPALSRQLAMSGHEDVACLASDRMLALGSAPDPGDWRPPSVQSDSLALLQYTSGATGDPRGVMVSHGNLDANLRAIGEVIGADGGQVVVGGWLPLHHDMGLVGQLLYPLRFGATTVLMSPARFARRPAAWLEMISEYGVTVSGAPNSAYELCVQRVTDEQLAGVDLSGWRVAINGAEPVRAETVQAFERRFARVGLRRGVVRTGYGLAEATLLVSCGSGGAPPRVRPRPAAGLSAADWHSADSGTAVGGQVTGCGSVRGHELLIVDPESREPLPDGRVGEIWLRGDSVAQGYWRRPRETSETFGGRADARGRYLRTGDLGLIEDGELYVTGRLGDVMVVEGRNLHPQDVEHAVRGVSPLFGAGVVFAVRGARDHVVVVQEVRADPAAPADLAGLALEVRERVRTEFEAGAEAVVLVRPGTVRRTTSGKLERAAVRRLLTDGRLESLHTLIEPAIRRYIPT